MLIFVFGILPQWAVAQRTFGGPAPEPGASIEGFVSVDSFALRKEFLVSFRVLNEKMKLGFSEDDFISVAGRDELLEQIGVYLSEFCPVKVDGVLFSTDLDRIQFAQRDVKLGIVKDERDSIPFSDGLLAVVFGAKLQGSPEGVSIHWDLFDDNFDLGTTHADVSTMDKLLSEGARTKVSFITPLGIEENFASEAKPDLQWKIPAVPGSLLLMEMPVPEKPKKLVISIVGVGFSFFGIAILLRALTLQERHRRNGVLFGLFLLIASGLSWHLKLVEMEWSSGKREPIGKDMQMKVMRGLLGQIYHSFYFRDESAIYDSLASCVGETLLERIYFEVNRSLVLESQGGARVGINKVELTECVGEELVEGGIKAECRWRAEGTVTHWGHTHERKNGYHAVLTAEPEDEQWKLIELEILAEERLP